MVIHEEKGYRVLQHPYLEIFYIQKWMLKDNPRSYSQHYDFGTVETLNDIQQVNNWFLLNVRSKNENIS